MALNKELAQDSIDELQDIVADTDERISQLEAEIKELKKFRLTVETTIADVEDLCNLADNNDDSEYELVRSEVSLGLTTISKAAETVYPDADACQIAYVQDTCEEAEKNISETI